MRNQLILALSLFSVSLFGACSSSDPTVFQLGSNQAQNCPPGDQACIEQAWQAAGCNQVPGNIQTHEFRPSGPPDLNSDLTARERKAVEQLLGDKTPVTVQQWKAAYDAQNPAVLSHEESQKAVELACANGMCGN